MTMSGLAKRYRDAEAVPRLRKVACTPWCDRVLIRLLVGQCTEDVERVAPELAHSFGARDCRVYEHRPGWLWLELPTRDPLTAVIPALPVPESADPSAVAVGLREDGESLVVMIDKDTRATLMGVAAAALLYIASTAVLMGILPATELARSTAPFAAAGQHVLGVGLGAAFAVCALLRAQGCLTGWTLVTAETSRSGADAGAFPPIFRSRPGERVSAINVLTAGGLMSLVAVGTATPTLGEQFGTLANIAVILSLYAYVLAGASLARLSGALTPGRRLAGRLVAVAAIGGSLAIMASGKPLELALCLVPVAAAAVLYLWLRRR